MFIDGATRSGYVPAETTATTVDESQAESATSDIDKQKRQEYNKGDAKVGEAVRSVEAEVAAQQQNVNNVAKLIRIKCRNERLEGKRHPKTGVLFSKRIVSVDGQQYIVVAPEFDSVFDTQLPEKAWGASNRIHKTIANAKLKEAVELNSQIRKRFSAEQLEQITKGLTPSGFVWHHDVEVGRMQLVDAAIHRKTGHTGGRKIWGGGRKQTQIERMILV